MAGHIVIKDKIYTHFVTHATRFHSDDVFSTALLKLIWRFHSNAMDEFHYERLTIEEIKERKLLEDPECLIYDIGDTYYDHHKTPQVERDNGVPYAAFGKLWRDASSVFRLDQQLIDKIDKELVQPIDLNDNLGRPNIMSLTIYKANGPDTKNREDQDRRFAIMVELAFSTLFAWVSDAINAQMDMETIKKEAVVKMVDERQVILCKNRYPATTVSMVFPEAVCFIYPHTRGGIALQSLMKEFTEGFKSESTLYNLWLAPKKYRGKEESELRGLNPHMKFCHASGFLVTFDDGQEEEALKFVSEGVTPWNFSYL